MDTTKVQTEFKANPAQKDTLKLEATRRVVNRILLAVWSIMVVFLLLRVILEGVGSHATSSFATIIFVISDIFLFPFFGIFSGSESPFPTGTPSFDGVSLLAILCYSILFLLAFVIFYLVIKILKTEKQVDTTIKTNKPLDSSLSEKLLT